MSHDFFVSTTLKSEQVRQIGPQGEVKDEKSEEPLRALRTLYP